MIIVTGSVLLKPDATEEAFRLGREHSARSREETGCLAHNCYADLEVADRMHFFEKWSDLDALKSHFAVPESGRFVRRVAELAAAPPSIEIFASEPVEMDVL